MVKEHLKNITSTNSELWKSLSKKIKLSKIINLRKIKSEFDIQVICNEVISAVEQLLLVQVNEQELMTRKIKKHRWKPVSYTPLEYSDDYRWNQSAAIRVDWNSERWLKKPPHWWVYFDTDGTILGVIYESEMIDNWDYTAFLSREVADNPIGAMILLRVMKERLRKVVHQK